MGQEGYHQDIFVQNKMFFFHIPKHLSFQPFPPCYQSGDTISEEKVKLECEKTYSLLREKAGEIFSWSGCRVYSFRKKQFYIFVKLTFPSSGSLGKNS